MWFKTGSFTGLNTDAWLSNYAFGIGTTSMSNGTRLAVGNIEFNNDDITSVRNITGTGNVNISGIATADAFSGNFSVTQTSTNGSFYPLFVNSTNTGNRQLFVDNGQISYNPSTNILELFNLTVYSKLNLSDDVELYFEAVMMLGLTIMELKLSRVAVRNCCN